MKPSKGIIYLNKYQYGRIPLQNQWNNSNRPGNRTRMRNITSGIRTWENLRNGKSPTICADPREVQIHHLHQLCIEDWYQYLQLNDRKIPERFAGETKGINLFNYKILDIANK